MNPQTEQYLEYYNVKQAELKALKLQITTYCEEKMKELDYKGITEQDYCELKGRVDAFQEVIDYIKNI